MSEDRPAPPPRLLAVHMTTHGATVVQSDTAQSYFPPDHGDDAWAYFATKVHPRLQERTQGNC